MKRIKRNLLIKLFLAVFISVLLFGFRSNLQSEKACASYWGGCGDASHQSCPSGIGAISECISSVNVNVGIIVQGDGLQNGTTFRVDLYSPSCSEVTCLKTNDTITVGPYNGTSTQMSNYSDKIGCSTGQCGPTDILNANAYIQSGGLKTGATCDPVKDQNGTPIPGGVASQNIFSKNGTDVSFIFVFNCHMPQQITCTTTTTQACQPGTTCPTNWTPNTNLTCGDGQICCTQACTQMPAPQPTVTCSGCTN